MHGQGHDAHPHRPNDCLYDGKPVHLFCEDTSRQMGDEPIGDSKERKDDGRRKGEVEMTRHPDGVMNHLIHLVGSVDQSACACRYESEHANEGDRKASILPRKLSQPAE